MDRKIVRTIKLNLDHLNAGKRDKLKVFLRKYVEISNYFIHRFWSSKDCYGNYFDYKSVASITKRFNTTARLTQCIAKHSKEIIRQTRSRRTAKNRIPRITIPNARLDYRFFVLRKFDGAHEYIITLKSGLPSITIPITIPIYYKTKFLNKGWNLSKSIRFSETNGRLFLQFFIEKSFIKNEKVDGIGLDTGLNCMLAGSDGQRVGEDFSIVMQKNLKKKRYASIILNEIRRNVNNLNLDEIGVAVVEDLSYINRRAPRGKFSRKVNRLLSIWPYAKVHKCIMQKCDELGISVEKVNPAYTSQTCHACGNIDRTNRQGVLFKCRQCSWTLNADYNAALNIKTRWLMGQVVPIPSKSSYI